MSTPWPTSIKIESIQLKLNENKSANTSIFSRKRQTVDLAAGTADLLEGLITTRDLAQSDVRLLMGWMFAVGLYGEFTIADPDHAGNAAGITTGQVAGSGQTGQALIVDTLPASTLVILRGEPFQVRDQYKICTADTTTDGSGVCTIPFKPALRVSPADNDVVTFNTPVILCELLTEPYKDTDSLKRGKFQIAFRESLNNT